VLVAFDDIDPLALAVSVDDQEHAAIEASRTVLG